MQNQSQDIQQPLCVDCVCAPLSNYYAHEIPPPSLSPFATEGGRAPSSLLSATYAIYHSLDYLARSCSPLLSKFPSPPLLPNHPSSLFLGLIDFGRQ